MLISFAIPCYRSELTISKVIDEIRTTMEAIPRHTFEIICVNDCSPDDVYDVLCREAQKDERVKVINLAKNFGKQAALMAAFSKAQGDIIVSLDDDFQCPAYDVEKLLLPIEQDKCDISTAKYQVKRQAAWKNIGSKVNSLTANIILDRTNDIAIENFFAVKRFVIDEVIQYRNPYTYTEGLFLRTTRRVFQVQMEERCRADDRATGFTFMKSLSLWFNGFTAFSVKPLRISTALGFISAAAGFLYGLVCIIRKICNPQIMIGYTSIIVILLLIGGIILVCLGLIGEYIGRIYICINQAPQYVIRNTVNISERKQNGQ